MGIVDESLQALDLEAPAALHEVTRWIDSAMTRLGQEQCPRDTATADSGAGVDTARLAVLLSQSLCWERRLPFLVSSADAERFVPGEGLRDIERRALAQAVREGLIRPQARGLSLGVAMSRAQVLGTLYRLIESRGEPPLREGLVRRVGSGSVALRDEALGDENNEIVSSFSPSVRLYRESNGDVYASESLILLPGDRVRFRTGDRGIEILTLRSEGASFDRSSRFSHWIVRKTSEELSAAVNERHAVGEVLDLRPLRYGRSGRVTELQIVGTAGTEVVRGLAVRRALGIRENLFFADVQRGENGSVTAWIFTGRGWGHGVGMCQVGAYGMAAAGYDYRSILAQYYPGTVIQSVDNAGLTP
jgi:stage II sporulation protein D